MTSISRRSFLAVAAASGAAALSNTVSAQEKPSVSEKFKDYPAGAKSAAKYPALPEPLPDLSLTETFSLGKSPLNEGSCITACHWGIVRPQVRGGKMVALHPSTTTRLLRILTVFAICLILPQESIIRWSGKVT